MSRLYGLARSGHFLHTDSHDMWLWVWLLARGVSELWQQRGSCPVKAEYYPVTCRPRVCTTVSGSHLLAIMSLPRCLLKHLFVGLWLIPESGSVRHKVVELPGKPPPYLPPGPHCGASPPAVPSLHPTLRAQSSRLSCAQTSRLPVPFPTRRQQWARPWLSIRHALGCGGRQPENKTAPLS